MDITQNEENIDCPSKDSTSIELMNLSHEDLMEITQSTLDKIIPLDPLLSDLPTDVMLEEILSQIAVAHGQSITVNILRDTESTLNVVVPHDVTVAKLKKAIARHFEIYQKRLKNKMKISWKYIWKTYDLDYDGVVLDDCNASIGDYGVRNKTDLKFKKKLNKKHKY